MKEEKICTVCKKNFTWRKKWKKDWKNVIYCSERCQRNKSKHSYFYKFNSNSSSLKNF